MPKSIATAAVPSFRSIEAPSRLALFVTVTSAVASFVSAPPDTSTRLVALEVPDSVVPSASVISTVEPSKVRLPKA